MGGTPLAPDIRRAPYFQSLSQCYRFDNRHPGCKQGTSRGPQRRREPHKHRKVSHLCAVEPAIQIVSYQSCATSWDDWVGKEQACRSRRPLRAQKKRTREWRVLCTPSLREGRERCKGNRGGGEYGGNGAVFSWRYRLQNTGHRAQGRTRVQDIRFRAACETTIAYRRFPR